MPNSYTYTGDYRLAAGEIAYASLTSAYNITAWSRAADQLNIIDWQEPLEGSDIVSDFIESVESFDGSLKTWGNASFSWYVGYWTPLMIKQFLDTYLPSGLGSARVTVMTFNRSRGFVVYHATMHRPNLAEAVPVGDGYNRIRIPFVNAIEVTPP